MSIENVKQNLEKISVLNVLYDKLLNTEPKSESDAENARLKLRFIREEILKLSMENRKIIENIKNERKG